MWTKRYWLKYKGQPVRNFAAFDVFGVYAKFPKQTGVPSSAILHFAPPGDRAANRAREEADWANGNSF
jgi:hypothetical protein